MNLTSLVVEIVELSPHFVAKYPHSSFLINGYSEDANFSGISGHSDISSIYNSRYHLYLQKLSKFLLISSKLSRAAWLSKVCLKVPRYPKPPLEIRSISSTWISSCDANSSDKFNCSQAYFFISAFMRVFTSFTELAQIFESPLIPRYSVLTPLLYFLLINSSTCSAALWLATSDIFE